jgi:hypothetical protein
LSKNAISWLRAYQQRGGNMEGPVVPLRAEAVRLHSKIIEPSRFEVKSGHTKDLIWVPAFAMLMKRES